MHPDFQGQRIGGQLIGARFDLIRRLNLRGMVAGSLIMDYGKAADDVTPEQYVQDVINGVRFDNNLTKQLKKGFKVKNLIPNYVDDPRSKNWGVAICWENPDYVSQSKVVGRVLPRRLPVPPVPQPTPHVAQPGLRMTGR